MPVTTLTATRDAVMGKQTVGGTFSGWNGKDNHIQVGATSNYKWRGVIRFNVAAIPAGATINSVTLRLTYYSTSGVHAVGSSGTTLKIARMTADWLEGAIDPGEGNLTSGLEWHWDNRFDKWANTTAKTKWVSQGAQTSVEDISMREIFMEWYSGLYSNYGIILINEDQSNTNKALLFYSDDVGTEGWKPELIVDYTTNTPPTPSTVLSPAADAVINTLTPTFYAELNDVDADDYIWGSSIVVKDSLGQNVWTSAVQTTGTTQRSISLNYGYVDPYSNLVPLQSGQTYSWQILLYDSAKQSSGWSVSRSFTVNATPNTPNVTVTPGPLNAVPSATPNISVAHSDPDPADTLMHGYRIIIDVESTPGSGSWSVQYDSSDVDTSGSPVATVNTPSPTLTWGRSYRVKARTQDSFGAWSSYSAALPFTIAKTSVPINLNPTGSAITTATPTLSGARGSSNDTINAFSLRVYNDAQTVTMLAETRYTATTNGSSFSRVYAGSALVSGQAYRWQAKVESDIGGVSEWSALQRFVVQADVSVPTITSPVGDNAYTLTPTVAMNRAANFDRVQYEIYPESSTDSVLGTVHYASGTITKTLNTTYSATYAGTALTWDTGYKIRARVSPDAGVNWSAWSGLNWFKTQSAAGSPILTSVGGVTAVPAWITTSTPAFVIAENAGETGDIDKMQYRIYNAAGSTVIHDSGMIDVTNAATATLTYSGTLLLPGQDYQWDARYQSTLGPISPYSAKKQFRVNGPPHIPTDLYPPQSHVYRDTDTKTFRALFSDPDAATFADYPNAWEIDVQTIAEVAHDNQVITTSLNSGLNSRTWPGIAFTNGVDYMWRTRFRDSKNVWGAYSSWQSFRVSVPPNGTIETPSNNTTVQTVTPEVTWSYTGGTQRRYTIDIYESNPSGEQGAQVTTVQAFGTDVSRVLPAGFLRNNQWYLLTLTVWNTDYLSDPTPSTVNIQVVLDAPDPIIGVDSLADLDKSNITLSWSQMTLRVGHTFIAYRIYRRRKNLTEWVKVTDIGAVGTTYYVDWYAGNSVVYQYVIRAVTRKAGASVQMESGDDSEGGSFADTGIGADNWHFIGADRDVKHISTLIVTDEGHNRPIQQEVFETLGSDRKVIMRGFVLGHEGSITTLWVNSDMAAPEDEQVLMNETYHGRRIADYLTRNAGPHILKSPFGDVWDVQFATPQYNWLPTGHLELSLEYVETGNTSEDEF